MTLGICPTPKLRGSSLPLRRDRSVSSNATSALAGGSWRGVPRRSVLVQTAQRDDLESSESQRATHNNADTAAALADAHSISRASRAHSSPLSFNDRRRLPNLSCNSPGSTSCFSIHGIADPCLDDGLDLKVYQYMVELVRSGTTEERAAEVIRQWSGGGGVEAVDLRKLRGHFMLTTLAEVVRKHATPAVLPVTLTCLSYWSLGLLPGTDEAVLPPAVRGALVAANLLLLVYFASGSLRSTGRMFRVGRAALDFSGQAELVLLAMRDLAEGHGVLIQAALTPSATAATTTSVRSNAGPGASTAAITAAAGAPVVPAAIAAAAAAVQRHASRRRVLEASAAAMRHVKRQAAAAATTTVAAETPSLPAPVEGSLPYSSSSSSLPPASSHSSPSPSSSPTPREQPQPQPQPPTPLPTPTPSVSTPLSSLDSYLVMWQAAELSGGFDAVAELGMAAEAAEAAAAMYARYGDSARGGRIGDYELRRLLQDAGCPDLSPEERQLVLLMHSRDTTTTTTTTAAGAGAGAGAGLGLGSGSPKGRGRGKGWLTFAEWAAWWAATPTPTPTAAAE